MRICKIRLSFLVLFLLLNIQANAQTITVVGSSWAPEILPISEAGNDYVGTYITPTNQIKLNVTVPLLLGTGKVSVKYVPNPTWNDAFKMQINKLDNGLGLCVLCSIIPYGVSNFQDVTEIDTEIFRIIAVLNLASVNNINLSIRLSGVSVVVPVDNYSARLVFTIGPI